MHLARSPKPSTARAHRVSLIFKRSRRRIGDRGELPEQRVDHPPPLRDFARRLRDLGFEFLVQRLDRRKCCALRISESELRAFTATEDSNELLRCWACLSSAPLVAGRVSTICGQSCQIGEQLRTVHSNYDRFPIIVGYTSPRQGHFRGLRTSEPDARRRRLDLPGHSSIASPTHHRVVGGGIANHRVALSHGGFRRATHRPDGAGLPRSLRTGRQRPVDRPHRCERRGPRGDPGSEREARGQGRSILCKQGLPDRKWIALLG